MPHPPDCLPSSARFVDLRFIPRFEYGDMAGIAEISRTTNNTLLGTGFARFKGARIPWTVHYDEVLLVLEGEVTVQTDAGSLVAGPRDCIWLPKGTALTYLAEDALVFYAIQPANWKTESDP